MQDCTIPRGAGQQLIKNAHKAPMKNDLIKNSLPPSGVHARVFWKVAIWTGKIAANDKRLVKRSMRPPEIARSMVNFCCNYADRIARVVVKYQSVDTEISS